MEMCKISSLQASVLFEHCLRLNVTSIGIDYSRLPNFTNGQVRELAELDISTMHSWTCKDEPLPKATLELMKDKLLLEVLSSPFISCD